MRVLVPHRQTDRQQVLKICTHIELAAGVSLVKTDNLSSKTTSITNGMGTGRERRREGEKEGGREGGREERREEEEVEEERVGGKE